MLRSASMHLIRDMAFNNVAPPSMLFNKNDEGSYDVPDGLQRSSKVIATLMGMLPIQMMDGSVLYMCNADDETFGWRALKNASGTPDHVKTLIDLMIESFGIDADSTEPVPLAETSLVITIHSLRMSVQVVENWPARSAACLAQLQSMNTTTHSLGETAYESTNALAVALAKHESTWAPLMHALGLEKTDKNKALFLHTIRGVACSLTNIEFVNKANDVLGFGDFMSSIFYYMMNDLPDGFEQDILVDNFCTRLNNFLIHKELAESDGQRIKKWKPDMISALAYLMCLDAEQVSDEAVYRVLKRIESPRMNANLGFVEWFENSYSVNDNLLTSLFHLTVEITSGERAYTIKPKRPRRAAPATAAAGPSEPQPKRQRVEESSDDE